MVSAVVMRPSWMAQVIGTDLNPDASLATSFFSLQAINRIAPLNVTLLFLRHYFSVHRNRNVNKINLK